MHISKKFFPVLSAALIGCFLFISTADTLAAPPCKKNCGANTAPVITSSPVTTAAENALYQYAITATDAEGNALSYSLNQPPLGMTISQNIISWTPTYQQAGTYNVSIIVSDGAITATQNFTINVSNINRAPTISSQPANTVMVGQLYQYTILANDTDADALTYSLTLAPSGMTIQNNVITWTPTQEQLGTHAVTIAISDGRASVSQQFEIQVTPFVNQAPVITSSPVIKAHYGRLYTYEIMVVDPESTPLTYQLVTGPAGMSISANKLSWQVAYEQSGTHPVKVVISDGVNTVEQSFNITVSNFVNYPPSITSSPLVDAMTGQLYEYSIIATDAVGDQLTYTPMVMPVGMTLNGNKLSWSPISGVGKYFVWVMVKDQGGLTVHHEFNITVGSELNYNPSFISRPIVRAAAEVEYLYTLEATDVENDPLTYSLYQAPAGMTITNNQVKWTPTSAQVGTHNVLVRADDGKDIQNQNFNIQVFTPGLPVIISDPYPTEIEAGSVFKYKIEARDSNSPSLTYALVQAPRGVKLSGTTVTWSVGNKLGAYTIVVSASDGTNIYQQTINLTVKDIVNQKPYIYPFPFPGTRAFLNEEYRYVINAYDPDGDALTYELYTADSQEMTLTGNVFTWTTPYLPINYFRWYDVEVWVRDGFGGIAMKSWQIFFSLRDYIPKFYTSAPATGKVGQNYQYSMGASTPYCCQTPFVYGLKHAPQGMTVINNIINWTPTASQAGYHKVTATVTNDVGDVGEQTFEIKVDPINAAPVITSVAPTSMTYGETYKYSINATDADGDVLYFSPRNTPSGLFVDGNTITWTPSSSQIGTYTISVDVADLYNTVNQTFSLTVNGFVNYPPVFTTQPTTSANARSLYQYAVQATDANGHSITYSLSTKPTGMSISGNVIGWTPTDAQVGTHSVVVVANDGITTTQQFYQIAVGSFINTLPVISSQPKTSGMARTSYQYVIQASDVDGQQLSYSLIAKPAGMSISGNVISWIPTDAQVGNHSISVTVSDGIASVQQNFVVSVSAYNEPPQIFSNPITSVIANQLYQYVILVSDADDVSISLWATGVPSGMSFTGNVLTWLPNELQVGSYEIHLFASDGHTTVEQTFTLEVLPVPDNFPPVANAGPDVTVEEGELVTFDGSASHDNENNIVSFEWSMGGIVLANAVSFTKNDLPVGEHTLTLKVTDAYAEVSTDTVNVTVEHKLTACPSVPVTNDNQFVDHYPENDIAWTAANYSDVKEIEKGFNNARLLDKSISQYLRLPAQAEWDAMSVQEQGLYLLNSERLARGLKPFEGVAPAVVEIAQNYSDFIFSNNQMIGHYNDGLTPLQRLHANSDIQFNSDYAGKIESIYGGWSQGPMPTASSAVVKAVYMWAYMDKAPLSGKEWGHRDHVLQIGLDDNSGATGKEGLAGIGVSIGAYDPLTNNPANMGAVVVLNTFDPSFGWDHGDTVSVDASQAQVCNNRSHMTIDPNTVNNVVNLKALRLAPVDIYMTEGDTFTVHLIGVYEDGSEVDLSGSASFVADSRSVISVSSGTITALKHGSTYIRASVNGMSSNYVWVTVGQATDTSNLMGTEVEDYLEYIPDNATVDQYDAKALSLFTGNVLDRQGYPIADVSISILGHPEFGSVLTDAEGRFILAAGAGTQTIIYRKDGYLTLQRTATAASSNWTAMDDVTLLNVDLHKTVVDLNNTEPQTHTSTPVTDQWGTRSTTLVFGGISSAIVRSPDGGRREIDTFAVRATEYELPASMPGELPKETAFTYCSELQIDGVRDDESVEFDRPVVMYVDNFLGFDVGEIVPIGYYDRNSAQWKASGNGVVVVLLDMDSDGLVDGVDYTGDQLPDDVDGSGSVTDDAEGIAHYQPGSTYWRGSFSHFTPYDFNWGFLLDEQAKAPDAEAETSKEDETDKDCKNTASYVKPFQQSFHEDIPVTGTGMTLHYTSQRTEGYKHKVTVSVSGEEFPASVLQMVAKLEIGGRVFERTFSPQTNLEAEFYWDGTDVSGRRMKGLVIGNVSAGFKYSSEYSGAGNAATEGRGLGSFDIAWAMPGTNLLGIAGREDVILWNTSQITLKNTFDSQFADGWSLSNVHEATRDGMIYLGDGSVQEFKPLSRILRTGFNLSEHPGDDGYYQKGGSSIDYAIAEDGVLKDKVTGLDWEYAGVNPMFRTKVEAQNYCANEALPLNTGWRLPTVKELTYTIDKSSSQHNFPIYRFAALGYWHENTHNPDNRLIPVICVRGESINDTYITDLRRVNELDVVIDGQNGLMWQDDTSVKEDTYSWEGAIDHCEALEHAGFSDWRLPNINELAYTLPNAVFANQTTLPSGEVWGPSVSFRKPYWTSTPSYQSTAQAWGMESASYSHYGFTKTDLSYARCVRDDLTQSRSPYIFDEKGRHLRTIDLDTGNALQEYQYDEEGRLTAIVDQFGQSVTLQRDMFGKVTAIVSHDGYVTDLDVNEYNDMIKATYDDASYFTFEYVNSLMTIERDRKNSIFTHDFDVNGRVTQTTDPEEGTWSFYSQLLANGDTSFGYDSIEGNHFNVVSTTYANGDVQKITTEENGTQETHVRRADNLQETTDVCNVETVVDKVIDPKTKDEIPGTITVTLPSGLKQTTTISKTYGTGSSGSSSYTTTVDINGNVSTTTVDALEGVATSVSPEGRSSTRYFDPDTGLLLQVEPEGLLPTVYTYDVRGRIETTTTGARVTRHYYDASGKGQLTRTEASDGKTVAFAYDSVGRTEAVTYPDMNRTETGYDNNGNIDNVLVPSLQDYGFSFNSVDKATTSITPLLEETRFEYDRDRNLTDVFLPSGKSIHNEYTFDQLTRSTTAEGITTYSYLCGGKVDAVGLNGEVIDYGYDGNLVTSIAYQGTLSQVISQSYNNDFQMSSMTYAGKTTAIGYDDDGLVTAINGYTIGLRADNALPETVSNGTYQQTRTYNGYGEVNSASTAVSASSTYNYSLTYNNLGQITGKQETLSDGTVNNYVYTYHPDRRWLMTVTKNGSLVESYNYDANGNRVFQTNTARSINGVTAVYNAAEQLVSDGAGNTYQYTPDGYLQTKTTASGNVTYQYATDGSLMSVQMPDKTVSYINSPSGNRLAKLVDGVVVEKYLWLDKTTLLAVFDGNNNLKQRFEYALGQTPTSFEQAGQKYYIVNDHLGSPHVITNAQGQVIKALDYDAYGNVINDTNPNITIPFGFAGGLMDVDTGLIRFGFRDYDPQSGRWTARDPIGLGDGPNIYQYVQNDPISRVDPTGQSYILLAVIHWNRNALNQNVTNMQQVRDWQQLSPDKSVFHQQGEGNEGNMKFVSPDGHSEAVFDVNGNLVMDPLNMGTYNFFGPDNTLGHTLADILPYMIFGNTPSDMFNLSRFFTSWEAFLKWKEENGYGSCL